MSIESVSIPRDQALIIGKNLIMTTVAVAIKNVGHSPATNVVVRVQMSTEGTGSFEDIVRGECDNAVGDTNTPFGQKILQDKEGTPIDYPTKMSAKEVAQYWDQHGGAFSVIGCVAYRSGVSTETDYTGFIYTILLKEYPKVPARIPGDAIFLQDALGGFITK